MATKKITSFALSDIGLKRRINQDAFLKNDALGLYVIADGMGGHRGGEVASNLALEVVQQYCLDHPDLNGREILDQGINLSCVEIFNKSTECPDLTGMGTTVVAFLFQGDSLYIGQVGDSRAYLISQNSIWQLTEDHSLVNEEIRAGRLNIEEAANYQFKNVITRSVGYENQVTVDVYHRTLQENEIYLACTDGLSGLVTIKEIYDDISTHGPELGLKRLIDLANARGGDDNITLMVCKVEG